MSQYDMFQKLESVVCSETGGGVAAVVGSNMLKEQEGPPGSGGSIKSEPLVKEESDTPHTPQQHTPDLKDPTLTQNGLESKDSSKYGTLSNIYEPL